MCMCIYTLVCAYLQRVQNREMPWNWSYKQLPTVGAQNNLTPLQEKQVLLTTEPPTQSPHLYSNILQGGGAVIL